MTITLNHTIIHASDKEASARFLTDILGLQPHGHYGPFAVVEVGPTSLDFRNAEEPISSRHFAFLVSEEEFDEIFGRIRERGLEWWADPYHENPGEINRRDGGRGLYFEDPDGHNLEILTRPYGSGGS
jgi:catechol 2,3-dioxygenase-like lactoylglutathione lyase family enzyme